MHIYKNVILESYPESAFSRLDGQVLLNRNKEFLGYNERSTEVSKQKKSPTNYKKELQEVIDTVRSAKNNLGKISLHMEAEFPEADALGEALESLDDAIDIMEDALDVIE